MIRVAQPRTHLDDILSEYQFFERHSARIHARPEQLCAFMTLTILCTISGSSMRLRRLVIYPKVTSMKS